MTADSYISDCHNGGAALRLVPTLVFFGGILLALQVLHCLRVLFPGVLEHSSQRVFRLLRHLGVIQKLLDLLWMADAVSDNPDLKLFYFIVLLAGGRLNRLFLVVNLDSSRLRWGGFLRLGFLRLIGGLLGCG